MRKATVKRKTAETDVSVSLNLDGRGLCSAATGIPFLDHMLSLFAKHSSCDLKVKASGDTWVDDHHLVEDTGIVLGAAVKKALGSKSGIARYGQFLMPMDESLSYVALDLSGRPHLSFDVKFPRACRSAKGFDYSLVKEFFGAMVSSASVTLHVKNVSGGNSHHVAESVFKGFARAFGAAASKIRGRRGIPSTKMTL